jgi:hypothetical protein
MGFKNQNLQGNFSLNSNQLEVSDFMTTSTATKKQKPTEAMKIPALDCTLAKAIRYCMTI